MDEDEELWRIECGGGRVALEGEIALALEGPIAVRVDRIGAVDTGGVSYHVKSAASMQKRGLTFRAPRLIRLNNCWTAVQANDLELWKTGGSYCRR